MSSLASSVNISTFYELNLTILLNIFYNIMKIKEELYFLRWKGCFVKWVLPDDIQ